MLSIMSRRPASFSSCSAAVQGPRREPITVVMEAEVTSTALFCVNVPEMAPLLLLRLLLRAHSAATSAKARDSRS